MENFWSTLKTELVYRTTWRTRDQAENAIFAYVDGWYNRERIQKNLGWCSPDEYEAAWHTTPIDPTDPATITPEPAPGKIAHPPRNRGNLRNLTTMTADLLAMQDWLIGERVTARVWQGHQALIRPLHRADDVTGRVRVESVCAPMVGSDFQIYQPRRPSRLARS